MPATAADSPMARRANRPQQVIIQLDALIAIALLRPDLGYYAGTPENFVIQNPAWPGQGAAQNRRNISGRETFVFRRKPHQYSF